MLSDYSIDTDMLLWEKHGLCDMLFVTYSQYPSNEIKVVGDSYTVHMTCTEKWNGFLFKF